MGWRGTQNARDELYVLIDQNFGVGMGSKDAVLQELISFLDCDTITEFIDHLRQTGYIVDDEDSDSDAEEDESIDTESYEVVV